MNHTEAINAIKEKYDNLRMVTTFKKEGAILHCRPDREIYYNSECVVEIQTNRYSVCGHAATYEAATKMACNQLDLLLETKSTHRENSGVAADSEKGGE
jgi:hypothetical protein